MQEKELRGKEDDFTGERAGEPGRWGSEGGRGVLNAAVRGRIVDYWGRGRG